MIRTFCDRCGREAALAVVDLGYVIAGEMRAYCQDHAVTLPRSSELCSRCAQEIAEIFRRRPEEKK